MSSSTPKNSITTTYVHSEGTVSLAYSTDARYLYSGGADGIRCFDLTESIDAAKTIEYHRDPVTYLDCSSKYLASCSESGETVFHDHATSSDQTASFNSLITRTLLATRCVKFSPDQRKLAVSSDESSIKIVDVEDPLNCFMLNGHTKPVKSLCWSHDSIELVSSGCEGFLRIWHMNKRKSLEEPTCSQVIDDIIPILAPESYESNEAIWHPSGQYFMAPSRQSGLAILTKQAPDQKWKLSKLVCQPDQSKQTMPITALKFSPNGQYLATGCKEGMIVVWSTQTWSPETSIHPESGCAITAIQWRPKSNSIVAANDLGQVTTWQDVISSTKPLPFDASSFPTMDAPVEDAIEAFQNQVASDVAEDDAAYADEDWVIDDIPPARTSGKKGLEKNLFTSKSSTRHQRVPPELSNLHGQEFFQPGATTNRHGFSPDGQPTRRYMAFNLLGLVYVLEKEEENIVTVEFHDKGLRNGYHFTDRFKYNLSSIGNLGVAFGCKSSRSSASAIRYEPFESWTTSGVAFGGSEQIGMDEEASWVYELPAGESVTCLACEGRANEEGKMEMGGLVGSGTVAVGTNQGYVRLFSGSGVQTYIWSLGQQIISLACSHEFIFVVHRSSILPQTHPLKYTLMDTSTFEIVQEGSIPLPNVGVVLTWIGFSHPHSIPACFDSVGVLSFLDRARRPRQGRWVPMLNTASLKTEGQLDRVYWPVGVSETELSCIILRGGETQPPIPAPVVQEVPLQMPILQFDSPQGQLEESYLRGTLIHNHQVDLADPEDASLARQHSIDQLELDKQLLKLIEICCKTEPTPSLQKALDYAICLKNMNTLEACMKIAQFFNLSGLGERVSQLHQAREIENDITKGDLNHKRKSKYQHLEDYNIITNSKISNNKRKATNSDLFERPFTELPSNNASSSIVGGQTTRLFNQSNVFKAPAPLRRVHQVEETDLHQDDDGAFDLASDAHQDFPTDSLMQDALDFPPTLAKRPKLSEYSLGSGESNTPRESTNPFAKKPPKPESQQQQQTSMGNLFGSKKGTNRTPAELKKSGKFFDRVDERNGVVKVTNENVNNCTKVKTKQATLLQFRPPNKSIDEDEKTSIKKPPKNVSNKEGEMTESKKKKTMVEKPITGFLKHTTTTTTKKQNDTTNDAREDSQTKNSLNVDDESQLSLTSLDFSQSLPPRIRSTLPLPHPPLDDDDQMSSEQNLSSQTGLDPSPTTTTTINNNNQSSKLEAFRSKIK